MKRLLGVLIILLIGWNAFLSYELYTIKFKETTTTVEKGVTSGRTEIASNVSDVVLASEGKVVTVTTKVLNEKASTGSGAVYKTNGSTVYIITNHHVIDGGSTWVITFADGSAKEAELVGSDALSDLAVLKVDVEFEAQAFIFGDSSLVKKGEYVIAMGSPLGIEYQGSVSGGLISGIDRKVEMDSDGNGVADWDMNVFQTDAAINPGNSGGPLINMAGELIGINSMKIANTEIEGFGFSIPANEVVPIIEQLETYGEVKRPILGIAAEPLSSFTSFEKRFLHIDMELEKGIVIMKVAEGSPADKAGMKMGDILVSFDHQEITSFKQYRQLLYSKKVNDSVEITLHRDGTDMTVNVTLE